MEVKNLIQPLNGVVFNENQNTVTLTVKYCTKEDYVETIKSLLHYVGSLEEDADDRNSRSYVCNLIDSMLPDFRQISNISQLQENTSPNT